MGRLPATSLTSSLAAPGHLCGEGQEDTLYFGRERVWNYDVSPPPLIVDDYLNPEAGHSNAAALPVGAQKPGSTSLQASWLVAPVASL